MGLEVEWVAEWQSDPGDRTILDHAYANGQVLLTRDKDFDDLIFRDSMSHSGALRLAGEMNYADQARLCLQVINTYRLDLERGCIMTVEAGGRIRVSSRKAAH
jgi:predicted nuclease of predicted toxin-antitoxin system